MPSEAGQTKNSKIYYKNTPLPPWRFSGCPPKYKHLVALLGERNRIPISAHSDQLRPRLWRS